MNVCGSILDPGTHMCTMTLCRRCLDRCTPICTMVLCRSVLYPGTYMCTITLWRSTQDPGTHVCTMTLCWSILDPVIHVCTLTVQVCSYIPCCEISFQGLGGYMKAAFWIWSAISSSSLNGNVPLRLKTPTNHTFVCQHVTTKSQKSPLHNHFIA